MLLDPVSNIKIRIQILGPMESNHFFNKYSYQNFTISYFCFLDCLMDKAASGGGTQQKFASKQVK